MKTYVWMVLLLTASISACTSNQAMLRQKSEASRELAGAYIKQEKYTLALRELLKGEQYFADDPDLQNDLGFVYMQKNRLDLAIRHFKRALELKPDYASAKNNLGVAYLRNKEWDNAIICFKELSENLIYTTPQKPMVNLGVAYYNKKEYELAEQYYNNALNLYREGFKKDLDYLKAVYGLSQVYLDTGRAAMAVSSLQLAIPDAPRAYPLYFNLAVAYELLRDYNHAYDAYQKVIEIAPDSEQGQQAKLAAEKIKSFRN